MIICVSGISGYISYGNDIYIYILYQEYNIYIYIKYYIRNIIYIYMFGYDNSLDMRIYIYIQTYPNFLNIAESLGRFASSQFPM